MSLLAPAALGLAALAIPRFMQATVKSKQSEAKQILKQIYTMQRAYRQEVTPATYAHNGDTRTAGQVSAIPMW